MKENYVGVREAKGLKKGARIAQLEEASYKAEEKCLSLQEQVDQQGMLLKKAMEQYKKVTNNAEELYHGITPFQSAVQDSLDVEQNTLWRSNVLWTRFGQCNNNWS